MSGQILVVDGAATNRITLKVRLAAACYDPLTARTGAEALSILARSRPLLVLIGGPTADMSAIELCALCVATAPAVPVLIVAPHQDRVAALSAGAAAVLDSPMDEMNLFARIRGLMRDQGGAPAHAVSGFAETQESFDLGMPDPGVSVPSLLLIADDAATALAWRRALTPRLAADLRIADPERALAENALGQVPDLYMIAADIAQQGDGLRLLSELRSRRGSRDAAFAVVLSAGRQDMMSVALDLGAGDVLPATLTARDVADEAALRLSALIRRKRSADGQRAAAERERSLARIDPLTGLPNRRFALPRLTELCTGGRGPDRPCAVVAIDIDRFKMVNDQYGHAAGDAVLAAVARRLSATVPAPGFIARIGGEEFLAVLPDLDETAATALAGRMRAAVSDQPIPLPGRDAGAALRVTVSAGVASLGSAAGVEPGARAALLLEGADDALLRAKRAGRDRLAVWGLGVAA